MVSVFHCVEINTGIDVVFSYIKNLEGIAKWWTDNSEVVSKAPVIYQFKFSTGTSNKMEVVEQEENKSIKWRCLAGHDQWLETIISFKLEEVEDNKTLLKFEHTNWSSQTNLFGKCNHFWGYYLNRLKRSAESKFQYDWERFYLHMYYHCDIETVFESWATAKGQSSFFVKECNVKRDGNSLGPEAYLAPGDKYEYLWEDGGKSKGEILAVDKENFSLVFSFAGAKVQVKLKEKSAKVLLELKHFDIPQESQYVDQLDCRSGWTHFLVNLKCVLEKGVDIREENPEYAGTLGWGIRPPEGFILGQ